MKEFLREQIERRPSVPLKRSLVREYLQARVLQALQDAGAFLTWAFMGGTSLRFLYAIARYSEDLDFALVEPGKECRFEQVLQRIRSAFEAEDYALSIKASPAKAEKAAFVKFPGLLYELGLSAHRTETCSVKIEIDTNPPTGAVTETTIVRRFVTVNLLHHDRASLLAGKLNAILSRRYTKGRDIYDLVWFLSDRSWPAPNLALLNAGLQQTGWPGPVITAGNLRQSLAERLAKLDWAAVRNDLQPFLERQEDLALVTQQNCMQLLAARDTWG